MPSIDKSKVSPAKFAHIVLRTTPEQYEAMVQWYITVLGAHVIHGDGVFSFLSYDDEHHRVAIGAMPGVVDRPDNSKGADHFAFTYSDLGQLLGQYARLKGEGIEPFWCINHGPTVSMYYNDPDGNRVEFQIDVFQTKEDAMAAMNSMDFDANPVGVMYDPEEMIARYEAGEPFEELTKRRPLAEGESFMDHLR